MTGTFMTPVSSTQHSASVTGLSNNTTYTYYVKCTDPAGNITPADTVLSFSVNASPTDIIAPTQPTAVVGTALNANQVQLSFTPATDAVGVAGYQVFACITDSCFTYDLVANGGGSPIIVNGLQSNTRYNFKLRAFDAVQNLGDFSSVVVVITPILDTISPSRLLNLVATRTGYDTFLLTWDPGTDDNQIAGAAIEICVGDGCNVFKLQYIVTGRTSITINGLASQFALLFSR
jgi:chitodextrinase